MNLDYPFYEVIIPQNKPLELNTIVNKYYKLDDNFTPDDLIYINDTYANTSDPAYKYRKHQMRKVVYDDFIALKKHVKLKALIYTSLVAIVRQPGKPKSIIIW